MADSSKNRFSDVLGAIVASVAQARSVADVEALRIARRYRQNDLLKGLPVPRLRLKRVSISLPVILSDVIPGAAAQQNPSDLIARRSRETMTAGLGRIRSRLDSATAIEGLPATERQQLGAYQKIFQFAVNLTLEEKRVDEKFEDSCARAVEQALRSLEIRHGEEAPSDVAIIDAVGEAVEQTVRDLLNEVVYRYIKDRVEKEEETRGDFDERRARESRDRIVRHPLMDEFALDVREAAEDAALKAPTVSPDFHVSVDTDEIRNSGGGPDVVTRLGLVLFEEGLEWVTETKEGGDTAKLLPE